MDYKIIKGRTSEENHTLKLCLFTFFYSIIFYGVITLDKLSGSIPNSNKVFLKTFVNKYFLIFVDFFGLKKYLDNTNISSFLVGFEHSFFISLVYLILLIVITLLTILLLVIFLPRDLKTIFVNRLRPLLIAITGLNYLFFLVFKQIATFLVEMEIFSNYSFHILYILCGILVALALYIYIINILKGLKRSVKSYKSKKCSFLNKTTFIVLCALFFTHWNFRFYHSLRFFFDDVTATINLFYIVNIFINTIFIRLFVYFALQPLNLSRPIFLVILGSYLIADRITIFIIGPLRVILYNSLENIFYNSSTVSPYKLAHIYLITAFIQGITLYLLLKFSSKEKVMRI